MGTRVAAPFHVNVYLLAHQLQLVHMTKLLPVFYQVHSSLTALVVMPTQLGHTIVLEFMRLYLVRSLTSQIYLYLIYCWSNRYWFVIRNRWYRWQQQKVWIKKKKKRRRSNNEACCWYRTIVKVSLGGSSRMIIKIVHVWSSSSMIVLL